jgi:hypothetical protein
VDLAPGGLLIFHLDRKSSEPSSKAVTRCRLSDFRRRPELLFETLDFGTN